MTPATSPALNATASRSGTSPAAASGDTFDLIVIGAGGAGMAAALFAAIEGLSVLLIEKTGFVGGTTAFSAGTTWIPNTRHAATVGVTDSVGAVEGYLDRVTGPYGSKALRKAFLVHGPRALDVLEAQSDVKFRPYATHPDYESDLDGATLRGRALEPVPFDGRLLGASFGRVRPPIPEFTVLGGMMVDRNDVNKLLGATRSWASATYALKIVGRHARDRIRHSRGTRLVMGNALIARLLHSLNQRQVPIWTDCAVEAFDLEGARVTGVTVTRDGKQRRVTARGGVVLASGGFNRHPQLRAKLLPAAPIYTPGAPGHTGEALALALGAGAKIGSNNDQSAFWAPVSVRQRADGTTAVFPHFIMDRAKPGTVVVNLAGERFVNESVSYHRFGKAMFAAHAASPSIPAFLVADAAALKKYGLGMVRPGGRGLQPFLADGYLVAGATLRELAGKLGVNAGGLERTVAQMNEFAATGRDPQFHRGETDYQRNIGDAASKPNPNLGRIATAPFYAVRLYPGDIGAAAGLVTDADARVLGADEQPIAGLHAAGNDMNSIMGGTYPGPGITIGPGIVFAYLAIQDVKRSLA